MNARKNVPCIVLVLTAALFASIVSSPQTVVPAPRDLKPFPKSTAPLMRGVDTRCEFFFRSTISGHDRVEFYYLQDGKTTDVSLLFANLTVVPGENAVPTVRPLDGDWNSQDGRWELIMSIATRTTNAACLPLFKNPSP